MGECFLKKLTVMYIQKGFKPLKLTLIFQCGISPLFFLLKILSIFNTHTLEEKRRFLKKTYNDVYPKGPNF